MIDYIAMERIIAKTRKKAGLTQAKLADRCGITESYVSQVERGKTIEAIKTDPVWHNFFYLELTAGLRLGEICGFKWEDFDEKKGTLKIQRSIGRTISSKNITVGDPKTEKDKRTIKLPDSTFQVLLRRKEKYKGDWVFPSI